MEPIIIEELARKLEDQGEQLGSREGEQLGSRAIVELAKASGLTLDEGRRVWIASASLEELERVRIAMKRDEARWAWPE